MKDKKLEEAVDYVCSCCPYIFSGSAEWDKSNPAFADWRDSATKYCDRCMVRKMTDFYNALDEHEFSEGMDSLKGDCYRFRVHYPEEWEFGLITGATFFGKRGLVLQHGEDDVSSFTLNPSWLSCEDETQRCIMVEIYLEP